MTSERMRLALPGFHPRFGRVLCLLTFLLPLACANNQPSAVKDKIALVIGNSAYTSLSALANPAKDAEDVCGALKRVGFKAECLTQISASLDFEAHVNKFVSSIGPNSAAVFYYSGHGLQAAGQNYLVPTGAHVNSAREDPLPQLYPLSHLFDKLRQKPTAFQMVILDACRTDPFGPQSPEIASTKSAVSAATRAPFIKSLEVVARATYGTALINDAPVGTIVLYATASRDTAYDGVDGNGPLTKQFLRNVEIRGMTVEDLTKNVISGVQDETKQLFGMPQTPFVYQSFRNTFCFADCIGFGPTRVPPTP
jgi:uncharacterized caspase-like protein